MPRTFRGYEIHEKIGSGGMSTLYRGTQKTLNRKVALKLLHPGLADDEQFIARFELEAKTASAIGHRNIVSVIDFGSEDDVYFIVMEYVDGMDLKAVHQKIGKLPHEIALAILEEVSYGLNAAHEAGVIHRDIKPGNVLLSSNGDVKIVDFGLARQTSDIDRLSALTVPGSVLGTPAYMSPEQAAGKSVDHRSDIYSLGVMAYELLSGEKPFRGGSYSDVRDEIINQEPDPLRLKAPVMPEIEALVAKMLAKDPDGRFQSMRQVIRAIENCMETLDPSQGLLKHRRKYLAKFAQDPPGFSERLRRMSVSTHLDRGFHFKNMGLAKIDSAVQEFRYVLFLDPENENASSAIRELERQAEASGTTAPATDPSGAAGDGHTRVFSPGAGDRAGAAGDREDLTDATRAEPAAPGRRGRRWAPWIGAAVVVLAGAAFAVWQLRPEPLPPESAAPEPAAPAADAPPVAPEPAVPVTGLHVSSLPAGADVAIRRPGEGEFRSLGTTPLETEEIAAGTWEIRLTAGDLGRVTRTVDVPDDGIASLAVDVARDADRGRIAVSTSPPAARVGVRRNGAGAFEPLPDPTPTTSAPLMAGDWQVRVSLAGHDSMTRDVVVGKDRTADLSFALRESTPAPAPDGYAVVVATPYADVYLDGKQVATDARRSLVQISSGRAHTLELRHPTFGTKRFGDVRVAAGDTVDLGVFEFRWSTLRVYCEPPVVAAVTVDGTEQDRQTPYSGRIGAGTHTIAVNRPGWRVRHAVVEDREGTESLVTPGGPDGAIPVEVGASDELSVKFVLEKIE